MNRRQSIPNGYQVPPGMKLVPATPPPISYINGSVQSHQPIPMAPQSFNRGVPSRLDYHNPYLQQNHSFRTQSSMTSTRPLVRPAEQYPNQGLRNKPTSWLYKPLCLGLTRLSGGILFGTMSLLAVGALSGLIVAVVLYNQDNTTNGQWKILGMVVCAILLLTILITFCIFIYCYKTGHIIGGGTNNNAFTSGENQENDGNKSYHYNPSYDHSSSSYGHNPDISPYSNYPEDVIHVQDKQTNTETTMCPLRPRDIQRGVWTPMNAYGGISYRPSQSARTIDRFIQVDQNDIDHTLAQQTNPFVPRAALRQPGTRLASAEEQQQQQYPYRSNKAQPQYGMVEDIIERPRGQQWNDYGGFSKPRGQDSNKHKYSKVSVTRVRTIEEPTVEDNNRTTDHFYQ